MQAAQLQGFGELGAIGALAALDLGKLGNQFPIPAVEIVTNGTLLCLQSEAGSPLLLGRDPVIGNERAGAFRVHDCNPIVTLFATCVAYNVTGIRNPATVFGALNPKLMSRRATGWRTRKRQSKVSDAVSA